MIGRIEFPWRDGKTLTATLQNNGVWTCSDPIARTMLNALATPGPGWRPPGGQLHDGAALRKGRVIDEVEEVIDPNVEY